MKIKSFFILIFALIISSQATAASLSSRCGPKHVIIRLFQVLINLDVDKKVDEFICNHAFELFVSESTEAEALESQKFRSNQEYVNVIIEQYKQHRKIYSPIDVTINFRRQATLEWQNGEKSGAYLFEECIKNLTELYNEMEKAIGTKPNALDRSAIYACIQVLFSPNQESVIIDDKLTLEQCFSINHHGLALLNYIFDAAAHNVYIIEDLPKEWVSTLINKFPNIFGLIYPTFLGLSTIGSVPIESRCCFSCYAKKSVESTEFIESFCRWYHITMHDGKPSPNTCVLIDFSTDTCKIFGYNNVNPVVFGVIDGMSEEFRIGSWKKLIASLKFCGVFEQSQNYSYNIPKKWLQ